MGTQNLQIAYRRDLLGYGLIRPLQRLGGNDFVTAEGEALIASAVKQILSTRPGELPWRPSFGMNLEVYRHQNNNEGLAALIADSVVEALQLWEPRLEISEAFVSIEDSTINVRVVWQVVSRASTGSNVLLGPVQQEVEI